MNYLHFWIEYVLIYRISYSDTLIWDKQWKTKGNFSILLLPVHIFESKYFSRLTSVNITVIKFISFMLLLSEVVWITQIILKNYVSCGPSRAFGIEIHFISIIYCLLFFILIWQHFEVISNKSRIEVIWIGIRVSCSVSFCYFKVTYTKLHIRKGWINQY